MITFSPAIYSTCSLLKGHQTCVHECGLSCAFIWFSQCLKTLKNKWYLTVQQPPRSSLTAHQVTFVWCTHKPKLLILPTYQAGAYASCMRGLVLSSHLFPVLPSPGQHTSLKLLPVSSGEYLKEDCADVDIILCSKCLWRCMSCWALL